MLSDLSSASMSEKFDLIRVFFLPLGSLPLSVNAAVGFVSV